MVSIHFFSVKADRAGPLVAARGLFYIHIKFKRGYLVQFKQEAHYVSKTSDRRRIGFVAKDKGRRCIQMFCYFVYDINGNLDFSGFVLLYGTQRFPNKVSQLSLIQSFAFSQCFYPPVSYTHLDVYKRQEIDHVVRNDDDIEKALDLVDREVLIKLLGIEQEICSQCRVIWKKMQRRRLRRG